MYELLLLARWQAFYKFPDNCYVSPGTEEIPTTFTFTLTHGCTVCGTPRGETLRASPKHWDVIEAYGGNDRVIGGAGSDQIHGYHGNDLLIGGRGRDWLYGENGNDVLRARDGVRDRVISCGEGRDVAYVDSKDPKPLSCERVVR